MAAKNEELLCPFQPQLRENKKFQNVQSNYKDNVLENILVEKKKKEKKIQELKKYMNKLIQFYIFLSIKKT